MTIDTTKLSPAELIELLQARGSDQEWLWAQARAARGSAGADSVVLRGVIEISSHCQKNCNYCAMRATNQALDRYRMQMDEIWQIAKEIDRGGVPILFLQGGQDPQMDAALLELLPRVKRELGLQILLCLGERPKETYAKFAAAGADSYILKFEAGTPEMYKHIAHTPLERRLQCIKDLQSLGYRVGTGNIVGLPEQTLSHLAADIRLAFDLGTDFISSSPFIPNQNTPLEHVPYGDLDLTWNTMAIYRLGRPSALIPTVSALEKIQPDGQLKGLNAGANVLTINFTPSRQRDRYAIYSEQRFIVSRDHALRTIDRAGLLLRYPMPVGV
jgi:biotin synthase